MSAQSDETPLPGMVTPDRPKSRRDSRNGYCNTCRALWAGMSTAHCTACHRTFTGLKAFDKHRAGSHPYNTRHCIYPVKAGLTDAGRTYPCWGTSEEDKRWDSE